jgi:hypothetical protein
MYSLKQSGRKSYKRLTQPFVSHELVISNFDLCILIYNPDAFFITIYENDITLDSPSGPIMKKVKNTLKSEFEVMDLEDLHWLFRLQIKFRPKGIELSLTIYIDVILVRFGLQNCNPTILLID